MTIWDGPIPPDTGSALISRKPLRFSPLNHTCSCVEDQLIITNWSVYSCTSNFSAIWRLSPLPVTGLQILAYARLSGPLSREGSLSCHTYCDTELRFIWSHPKDRHPHPTVGLKPPTQGSLDHCARHSNHCATQAA
jgi:hypothetical protein